MHRIVRFSVYAAVCAERQQPPRAVLCYFLPFCFLYVPLTYVTFANKPICNSKFLEELSPNIKIDEKIVLSNVEIYIKP